MLSKIDQVPRVPKLAYLSPSSITLNLRVAHPRVFKPWHLSSDFIALDFRIDRSWVFKP